MHREISPVNLSLNEGQDENWENESPQFPENISEITLNDSICKLPFFKNVSSQ